MFNRAGTPATVYVHPDTYSDVIDGKPRPWPHQHVWTKEEAEREFQSAIDEERELYAAAFVLTGAWVDAASFFLFSIATLYRSAILVLEQPLTRGKSCILRRLCGRTVLGPTCCSAHLFYVILLVRLFFPPNPCWC